MAQLAGRDQKSAAAEANGQLVHGADLQHLPLFTAVHQIRGAQHRHWIGTLEERELPLDHHQIPDPKLPRSWYQWGNTVRPLLGLIDRLIDRWTGQARHRPAGLTKDGLAALAGYPVAGQSSLPLLSRT